MVKKKKKKEEVLDPGPLEYEGWKLGQEVWCKRFPTEELACGPITKICLTDSEPCFTFVDKFSGSYRMALFSSIIPIPTKAMWNKLNRFHVRDAKKAERRADKLAAKKAGTQVRRK